MRRRARVTADTKVGVTRHKVIARKDVIVRLETPRFLTQGDTVTLSGIVHNYLKARQIDTDLDLGLWARNCLVRHNKQ